MMGGKRICDICDTPPSYFVCVLPWKNPWFSQHSESSWDGGLFSRSFELLCVKNYFCGVPFLKAGRDWKTWYVGEVAHI